MVLLLDTPVESLVTRLSEFTLPVTRGTLVQQHTKFYREVQKTYHRSGKNIAPGSEKTVRHVPQT